jgi:hypothetical protein
MFFDLSLRWKAGTKHKYAQLVWADLLWKENAEGLWLILGPLVTYYGHG